MGEITGVIERVVNVNGRYEVTAAGKKLSTFKEDIARQAMALEGAEAILTFTTQTKEKDGRTYTNTYLDKVTPAVPSLPEIPVLDGNEQRRTDIRWQVAFKAAVELANKPGVDLEAVFALTDVIYEGLTRRQA